MIATGSWLWSAVLVSVAALGAGDDGSTDGAGLSDHVLPLQLEGFPERPRPLLELGEPFLGTGTLDEGLRLPTGAVWQPSLLAFGTFRTGLQTFDSGAVPAGAPSGAGSRVTEWANRLDLFFNLALSGSERLVVGFRALDRDGRFSGYVFESPDPAVDGDFREELNLELGSLFFEGDFGEIFPNLDRADRRSLDFGFAVGRQPLSFQEGILIQDTIDALGVTRNTLMPRRTSNFRLTFLYGWGEVNRGGRDTGIGSGALAGNNPEDRRADLFALLTSTDVRRSTIDADLVWVQSDDPRGGDLLAGGVSAVQRIGAFNTSFRVLASVATDDETAFARDGILLFSEVSWTPHHSHDHVYVNSFLALDEFVSAARAPTAGGPLGRAGINFAAVGLGSYGAPLSSRARDVFGAAIGYQKFFDATRRQLLVEAGLRIGTDDTVADAMAATVRYQAAFGRRLVLVLDGFLGRREGLGTQDDETIYGSRVELVVKF